MQPRFRSRSWKKIQKKVPSGKTRIAFRRAKPKKAVCSDCGSSLLGVPRGRPVDLKKLKKSERVPERIFSGALCSKCTKEKIKNAVRGC